MNPTLRLAAAAVLTIATVVAGAGIFGAGKASAAATTIECQVPLQVVCQVSNPDGIRQVIFTGDTPFGDIEWVNETYGNCPTSVEVVLGGDHVLSAGPIAAQVILCETSDSPLPGFKARHGDGDGDAKPALPREEISFNYTKLKIQPEDDSKIVVLLFLVQADGSVQPYPGDCYSHFPSCSLADYECQHLGQSCPPPSRP